MDYKAEYEKLKAELEEERYRHDRLQDWDRGLTAELEKVKAEFETYKENAVPVVRCCECKRRYDADECPMCFLRLDGVYHEYTNGNGYCDRGERRNGDATD